MSRTWPGPTGVGIPTGTGTPSSVDAPAAPATQTTVEDSKRSRGPRTTASKPAAPSGLPTARLARANETSSQAPEGGTPTAHSPDRPGRSCTVVATPGTSTSITPPTPAAAPGSG